MADIYSGNWIERSASPRHEGEPEDKTIPHTESRSRTCGDAVCVYLDYDDQDVIRHGYFTGDCCAVCKASADLMIDAIEGKTRKEAAQISEAFRRVMRDDVNGADIALIGQAAEMLPVRELPSRTKCACLPWKALELLL